MKSQRVVVPQKMRECLLQNLHRVHQGMDKSIQRATDKWFWPGMIEQIRRLILTFPSCLEHQPRQEQAATIPVITTNAMQILGCDIFPACRSMVQMHRRLPHRISVGETNQEPKSRYCDPCEHFQSVCKQFGYPMEVVSDQGSQYTSSDFQELCLKFNIIHKPGTPHSQWKNGRCKNIIGLRIYSRSPTKKKQQWTTYF